MKSPEGLAETINADVRPGDYLKQYFNRNGIGERRDPISYRAIAKATVYLKKTERGVEFVHPSLIAEIDEPALEECESEHIRMPKEHCVIPVKGLDGKVHRLSNKARLFSEVQSIKATSDTRTCAGCRYVKCPYNPDHVAVIQSKPQQIEHKPFPYTGMIL